MTENSNVRRVLKVLKRSPGTIEARCKCSIKGVDDQGNVLVEHYTQGKEETRDGIALDSFTHTVCGRMMLIPDQSDLEPLDAAERSFFEESKGKRVSIHTPNLTYHEIEGTLLGMTDKVYVLERTRLTGWNPQLETRFVSLIDRRPGVMIQRDLETKPHHP